MLEQLIRALAVNAVYMALTVFAALLVWRWVDKFFFRGLVFVEEIRKGNVAAALMASTLLAVCAFLVATGLN